jgi:hypothetical protein
MTADIENFIRAEARGEPHEKILEEQFGLPPGSDPVLIRKAEQKMYRWRHHPDAEAIWKDELAATVKRRLPGAINRINRQIESDNDWVANKAANDYVLLAKAIGYIQSQENALTVRVEGMPDIGSPDDE